MVTAPGQQLEMAGPDVRGPITSFDGARNITPANSLVNGLFLILASVISVAVGILAPAYGPLAVLVLGIGYYLLRRPALTYEVIVSLVPITSGLRRGLPVPGFRLSELLIVAGAVAFLLNAPRRPPRWMAVDWLAFTYVMLGIGLGIYNLTRRGISPVPLLPLIVAPIQFLFLYRMVIAGGHDTRARAVALRLLLLSSLPVSILGIAQGFIKGPIHALLINITATNVYDAVGYEPTFRVISVFSIWHALAGYLAIPILIGCGLLLADERGVLSRGWLAVVLVCAFGALALTLTITTVASIVLGIVLLGAWYRRTLVVLTALAMGGAVGFLVFGSRIMDRASQQAPSDTLAASVPSWLPQTAQFRVFVWENQFVPAMAGRWLTGYGGFGDDFPTNVTWKYTESDYITLFLRGGIGLTLVMVIFILALTGVAWMAQRRVTGTDRLILRVTVITSSLLLVMSFVWPYFTSSGMAQPLWVMWGLATAVIVWDRRGPSRTLTTTQLSASADHLEFNH